MAGTYGKVATPDGWEIFDGDPESPKSRKLAVVGCQQFTGDCMEKTVGTGKVTVPIMKALAREDWAIHFTSPTIKLPELLALVEALPKDAPPAHPLLAQ